MPARKAEKVFFGSGILVFFSYLFTDILSAEQQAQLKRPVISWGWQDRDGQSVWLTGSGKIPKRDECAEQVDFSDIVDDCIRVRGRRVGMALEQTLAWTLMTIIGIWGAGTLLSFAVNRMQIVSVAEQAHALVEHPSVSDYQLTALHTLRNDAGRLQQRIQDGAPWYQRFGLDHKLHVISKRYTQRIERHNLNLRLHLARLGRKSLSFSKSVELHDKVIGHYLNIKHYQ